MISYRTALCFVVAMGATSVVAFGQAGPGMLPTAFRSQLAFTPDEAKTIDTYVAGQFTRLGAADAEMQKVGREALVSGANGSPAYGDVYAQAVDNAVAQVLKGNNFRARLNAAIVAAHVADKTNSPRLAPVALQMIGDKNEGIVLWGVKTAKSVVPAIFQAMGAGGNATAAPLIKAVTQVALKGSGPIVAEAYQALAPRVTGMNNVDALVKATFPALMDLMQARVKAYADGVPDEPTAESGALLFVSQQAVWNVLTPQEQLEAMQVVSDLVGVAGQRWATGSRQDQEHMTPLLQQAGKALYVVGGYPNVNSPQVTAAGTALTRVNPSLPATQVSQATAAVYPALRAVPAFGALTAPPQVGTATAAPVANTADTGAKTNP